MVQKAEISASQKEIKILKENNVDDEEKQRNISHMWIRIWDKAVVWVNKKCIECSGGKSKESRLAAFRFAKSKKQKSC